MADDVVEDDIENNWVSVLPKVFELLLNKPEKIVDDTSIEKFLAFISNVCSTPSGRQTFLEHVSSFLSNENLILTNCTTVSFSLRLCGILWSSESSLFLEYPVWFGLFAKCRECDVLWREAVVRNAFFTALQGLTGFESGLHELLENQGYLKTAVESMSTDSSMFVASNARLLIAKFLISSSTRQRSENYLQRIDWLITILQQKLWQPPGSSTDKIAVLDIIRMLMNINVSAGQELLYEMKLFLHVVDMVDKDETDVCRKLVEVLGEIQQEYNKEDGPMGWNKLWCCENNRIAAKNLLKVILALYQRGMIEDSLNLVSLLACPRNEEIFPSSWFNALCCLLSAPLSILEDTTLQNNTHISNGIDSEPIDRDALTADLMSLTADNTTKYEVLNNKITKIIRPQMSNKNMKMLTLHQVLFSISDIVKKYSCIPHPIVNQWIGFTLKVLKSSSYHNSESICVEIHGNDKITKTVLTVIVVLLKQWLLLQSNTTTKYLFEILQAFIFLARSSQTKPTIISNTLESIAELIEHGSFIINQIYQETTSNNEPNASDPKRPRDDDFKNIIERLGFMLCLRLRDQRWEVKDSALELVIRLVKLNTGFSISIVGNQALSSVWDALDDTNESYVRSSSWQALAHIIDNHHLWVVLKESQKLTEINVIVKMEHTLEHESEAFPRRSIIDCILSWVRNRNSIVAVLLPKTPKVESTSKHDASSSDQMTLLFSSIIKRAFDDFDWEVKVRVLGIIKAVIENFSGEMSKYSTTEVQTDSINCNHDNRHFDCKSLLTVLYDVGALAPILKACDDCDNLVCENALLVLESLKRFMFSHPNLVEPEFGSRDRVTVKSGQEMKDCNIIKTMEQLVGNVKSATDVTPEVFKDIVSRVDMQRLISFCRATDHNVRSNPVCLLEDILAGGREDTENLLDCY